VGARMTALTDAYGAWLDELERRRLPTDWIITMIVDGMHPSEVDWRARSHHRRDLQEPRGAPSASSIVANHESG